MTTANSDSKQSEIHEAFKNELEEHGEALTKIAREWLEPWPSSTEGKSAEDLSKAVSALEVEPGVTRLKDSVAKTEVWYSKKLEAFVRALAEKHDVERSALLSESDAPEAKWLRSAMAGALEKTEEAMTSLVEAARALAGQEESVEEADRKAAVEKVEQAFKGVEERVEALRKDQQKRAAEEWKKSTTTLEEEGEERAANARKERSEHTKRAAEKAAESLKARQEATKKKREWYHWLIDIALFAVAAYLIKVRFIDKKEKEVPPPPPSAPVATSSVTPSVPGSAGGDRVLVNPTTVLRGPGVQFAPAEVLSAPVRAEVLETPPGGWVRIRLAGGKEGWVPLEAIASPNRRPKKP